MPIEQLLKEIENALRAHLYYVALLFSVTLPGICAALEDPSGSTVGKDSSEYKRWYTAHFAHKYSNLTDVDCYSLRCGVVHQGRFGHPKMQYGRVIFMLPDPRGNVFSDCILNDAYFTDVRKFCTDMVHSVRDWFTIAQNSPIVQRNLTNLVQLRPTGMKPYISGAPIIT